MVVNPNAERDRAAWRAFREPAEGGLSLDPDDAGNWYDGELIGSNYGVTGGTLEIYLGRRVTADDIASLTTDDADAVADQLYWLPCGGDLLVSGVNLMVVDFAWNCEMPSGHRSHRAVPMLQQVLGFGGRDVDGIVGPMTLLACRGVPTPDLINKLHAAQLAYYRRIGGDNYVRGWINRADARREAALALT